MMKKTLLIVSTSFLCISTTFAGFNSSPLDSVAYKPKPYLGAHLGTFGGGIQFAYPLSNLITLRATGSYFPSLNRTLTGTDEGAIVTTDINIQSGGAGIIADFSLLKNKPGIRLSVGALYNNSQATAVRSYLYESDSIDLGTLTLEFSPKFQISPYLGIVFGNLKKSKRVFFSMETGVLYQSNPQVVFTGTGHIAPTANESNTSIIENNVKSLQFLPYVNMQLNFKLF